MKPDINFKKDGDKAISKFDNLYSKASLNNRHVTVGDESISWTLRTGNHELIVKNYNLKTEAVEYTYLKERDSTQVYIKKTNEGQE